MQCKSLLMRVNIAVLCLVLRFTPLCRSSVASATSAGSGQGSSRRFDRRRSSSQRASALTSALSKMDPARTLKVANKRVRGQAPHAPLPLPLPLPHPLYFVCVYGNY
jgi:hypothetical protein